jgi:hypothetical protein
MTPSTPLHILAASAAAFLAGAINSVAGGGTLIKFPTLIGLGLPSEIANATNTVAIWPGALGSMWGFRREIREVDRRWAWLAIPIPFSPSSLPVNCGRSFLGGGIGATLLRITPPSIFDHLVPFLILFATLPVHNSGANPSTPTEKGSAT